MHKPPNTPETNELCALFRQLLAASDRPAFINAVSMVMGELGYVVVDKAMYYGMVSVARESIKGKK